MKNETVGVLRNREGEKGAALVMALLISFLLLIAAIGLITEATMNSSNVTDAIAEQQAFSAAESGLQSAIHILRCQKNTIAGCSDVVPNPLLVSTASATDTLNQISYRKALDPTTSNNTSDTSGVPRLSRWLSYNQNNVGGRVPIDSNGPVYSNLAGYAYSLDISDPDNTGGAISLGMTGRLYDRDSGDVTAKTYNYTNPTTLALGWLKIKYNPPSDLVNWDLNSQPIPSPYYGSFTITRDPLNVGAIVPANNRFEIAVRMTAPFNATKMIRGWILNTTSPNQIPAIIFDSQTLTFVGGALTLDFAGTSWVNPQIVGSGSPMGYRGGAILGDNIIKGTMSAPEPIRLLVKSTGYGPRGARKELQAIIRKNAFDSLTAPAALTLVGPHHTDNPTSDFFFSGGASAALLYSGVDLSTTSTDIIPPIGTTDPSNLGCIENYLIGAPVTTECLLANANGSNPFNGTVSGSPSDISADTPFWLQSTAALDTQVHLLAATARSSGTFYPSGTTPSSWGNATSGTGITFCDGDVELGQGISGNGGGILVVTGSLTLKGTFTFNGLIIVTGPGGLLRSGGGTGKVTGNVVVAPYVNSRIADIINPETDLPAGKFLAPRYNMDGGGNSTLQFNSNALMNGLTAVSNFVLGVMEK